jgi:hypothetical protein
MIAKRPAMLVLATAGLLLSASAAHDQEELSFEDRVKAQEAIERVYYSHQLEARQSFEEAVPHSVLESKVTRYLKQSAALDQVWKTPVTAEMLKHEWERISRNTRFPERLPEIYAALGNDPVLVQECFVRPSLVDHLVRNLFQGDRLLQAGARQRAGQLQEALQLGSSRTDKEVPSVEFEVRALSHASADARSDGSAERERDSAAVDDRHVVREVSQEDLESWRRRLPGKPGQSLSEETATSFLVRVLHESSSSRLRFTQYEIDKQSWDPWWNLNQGSFDPGSVPVVATPDRLESPDRAGSSRTVAPVMETAGCLPADTWDNASLGGPPLPRVGHSAVWTGSLMLVWGGSLSGTLGSGERYDPLTDTWSEISLTGAPSNRSRHRAVWTGTEMIVWGGQGPSGTLLNDGGRYDPSLDTWSTLSAASGLSGRIGHTAVWTGTEMIVFGGRFFNNGARYNPVTDSWTPILTPGWSAKSNHSAVWTGTRMLVWSGNEGSAAIANGGAYDPSTNNWSTLATAGAPPASQSHSAVWTGSRMIVWGGEADDNSTALASGGIYDPGTDSWTLTSTSGAPAPRALHSAVWTGTEMIVWGGRSFSGSQETRLNSGGRFNPASNSWSSTNVLAAPDPIGEPTAVWTGDRMVVWGNRTGGRYDPSGNAWTPVSFGNTPRPLTSPAAVWTGNLMIVWGGLSETKAETNQGYRYNPLLDSWSPTSSLSAPSPRQKHAGAWTGNLMVVWGGLSGPDFLQTGGRYHPIADSWSAVGLAGSPASPRHSPSAIWTGSRVVIWGGRRFGGVTGVVLNTGALYDPAQDFWYPMMSAPHFRSEHTTIWTGTEMIVWGGDEFPTDGVHPTGERYNPSLNQWLAMSSTNAPSQRQFPTAQWTGSRMLIWGGRYFSELNTGAAYEPALDQWTPMSTSSAPPGRGHAVSVWTGKEMVVWGGDTVFGVGMNTGGRYDVTTDQWASTSLAGAPTARPAGHVAVWSGTHMIVWGVNVDAGRYVPEGNTTDSDSDGWSVCQGDCVDNNPAIHPGAVEACDGFDNNCDGTRDEGFPDLDADGFAACAGDCNDTDATINPSRPEVCNHRDDNCDAVVDEGFTDSDVDGYAACAGDCQDTNPGVNPGMTELCNGIDDNCNMLVDDRDIDGDGFTACGGTDCDDSNPAVHPGAAEVCNGLDDDCSGQADNLPDTDGDGFGQCDDCSDADPMVWVSPFEVTSLMTSESSQTTLTWDDQSWIGPETVYDVSSGPAGPNTGISFGPGSCLQAGQPVATYTDSRPDPGLLTAYWYLVRAKNSCGSGTYGTNHLGQERTLSPCP